MSETQALRAFGEMLERMRQTNSLLVGIVEDHSGHPKDRKRAADAIHVNMLTAVRIVKYLADEPSFSWHLVETPIKWETAMYEHLPTLQEWSIHT